jgi:hypothetical protein
MNEMETQENISVGLDFLSGPVSISIATSHLNGESQNDNGRGTWDRSSEWIDQRIYNKKSQTKSLSR